jgi:serine/threonine-protein kinase
MGTPPAAPPLQQEPPSKRELSHPKGTRLSRAESPSPSRRSEGQKGTLEFRIRPYATVLLNGKSLGQTPLPPVAVSAGFHTVRLINRDLGKDVTLTVEVKAGQPTVFKYNLLEE